MPEWFWFPRVVQEFSAACAPFAGRPIVYCEVGVWTGDSAEWVLKNILTHADSRGIGIDSYEKDWKRDQETIDQIALGTIERLKPYGDHWELIVDKSQHILPTWNKGKIDLLYLDGSHYAHDVVADFCYAWPHLKPGSRVIFDDYGVGGRAEVKSGMPNVPTAVRCILEAFAPLIKVAAQGRKQISIDVVKHRVGELAYKD